MHGLNFEVLWKGLVGRDAEVKILNPTATIVGTAHPDEHTFSISFRDRTDRQDILAKYNIFESLRHAQLKITRIWHSKNRRDTSSLGFFQLLFSHGAATYN